MRLHLPRRRFDALWATAIIVVGLSALGTPQASRAVDVSFTEWMTPSKPPYPHDPAYFSGDGSVWYSGQRANVIGRLDPNTGTFKE
jgi:streptogramin lyase